MVGYASKDGGVYVAGGYVDRYGRFNESARKDPRNGVTNRAGGAGRQRMRGQGGRGNGKGGKNGCKGGKNGKKGKGAALADGKGGKNDGKGDKDGKKGKDSKNCKDYFKGGTHRLDVTDPDTCLRVLANMSEVLRHQCGMRMPTPTHV